MINTDQPNKKPPDDPFAGLTATCSTCPCAYPVPGPVKVWRGVCRRESPRAALLPALNRIAAPGAGPQFEQHHMLPNVTAADWCGEHPLMRAMVERITNKVRRDLEQRAAAAAVNKQLAHRPGETMDS